MAKLVRDQEQPNLYIDQRSGIFQYRKSITMDGRPREVFKSLKTKNRPEAIRRMNQLLSQLPDFLGRKKRPTVYDLYLELLAVYQGKARKTFEGFESYSRNYILPHIGHLDPRDIKSHWDILKAKVKAQKPGMALEHLRKHTIRYLSRASETQLIDGIPKLLLDPDECSMGEPRAYEDKEVETVFVTNPSSKHHKFQERTIIKQRLMTKLPLFCGLRPPSEVVNLKWEFFDFDSCLLHLPKDFIKTRESRTVPVPPEVIAELLIWKENRTKQMKLSPYIFPNRNDPNRPMNTSDKTWQKFKKALGIDGKRYWFRHSHATAALEGGMNGIVVAKNMGTSLQMLERVYTRPGKDSIIRQAEIVRMKYRGIK